MRQVAELRRRLEEAEETIRAIREDEVDAFVVSHGESDRVLTLESADRPYRVLVESMQQGAVTLSADGTILYCNPRLADLLGRSQDGLAGLALLDLVPEGQRPACASLLRDGRVAGAQGEALFAREDGTTLPVHLAVSPLPVVGSAALCALVTDLTERKSFEQLQLAQAALREGEERLRLVHQAAGLGTFEWDAATGAMVWDAGFREVFGFGASAPASRELWRSALHPDDADRVEAPARDGREGGVSEAEYRIVRPRGDVRCVTVLSRLVGPAGAGRRRVIGICMDVTERKRSEDELRRARDELELRVRERTAELAQALESLEHETEVRGRTEQARLELLRRLVTVQEDERRRIARELHDELGQHLTALTLELKLLQGAIPEDSPARERLRRLQGLTGQFGREVHRLAVELRPTSLDEMGLATALANHLEEWAERTKVAVEFHRDGMEDVRAAAHVEMTVYRVLQETLTNVVKHASAGRVCVVLERQGSHLHLTVEDDGRGFDADAVTDSPGAGGRLGLLGMRERVAMVGGSLMIESSPGSHTTVFVRVPAFEDQGARPDGR